MKRTTYATRGNSKYSIEIPAQPSKLRDGRKIHNERNQERKCIKSWGIDTDNSFNMSEGEE